MLFIVLRKMMRNHWMVLCLLIGSILSVAMISSIPMYTDAVLERMLIKDLEKYQEDSGYFPGRYFAKLSYSFIPEDRRVEAFNVLNMRFSDTYRKSIDLPVVAGNQTLKIDSVAFIAESLKAEKPKNQYIDLRAMSGLVDHIKILHGRMFNPEPKGDVYEVVATEASMQKFNMLLNDEIYISESIEKDINKPFKIRIVGVCTISDPGDPYWAHNFMEYRETFFLDYNLFNEVFVKSNSTLLTGSEWYYAFDYHKMTLDKLDGILSAYENQSRWLKEYVSILDFKVPAIPYLEHYDLRESTLRVTLWVLMVPVLLMLAFYIFMVSQLIVQNDQNEIAVLKSRGAGSFQIFLCYLIESIIISGVALILGPFLGYFLCKLLGSANGFLEFVNRKSLSVSLTPKAYMYSFGAAGLFIVTMLVPVVMSTRTTIVQHKQKISRFKRMPFWQKYFIDFLLLGVASYGLYRYNQQQEILSLTGIMGVELRMDSILFLTTTVFILGAGLLFLRVYPYVMRLIFWMGRKIWSPSLYVSFIQVGRSRGQEQFLMLFLIFSISVGIYNANSARTINNNMVDKILYSTGAQIVVKGDWGGGTYYGVGDDGITSDVITLPYTEPRFEPYTKLEGVEMVTKVFSRDKVQARTISESVPNCRIMGIIPNEFGKVAWFRNDLLTCHWYHYLNYLTESPMAALLSSSFEELGVRIGDTIQVTWDRQESLECYVYGFVDYWPAFNPMSQEGSKSKPYLIVTNLSYIQDRMALEPYEVWIKKDEGASSTQVYNSMSENGIVLTQRKDSLEQTIENKNDPMLQGTNGALTLGFVVTMLISIIGFLIYWIISIQRRVLQFGILRAMGLSLGKVITMLIFEQFLISGIACIAGVLIGGMTSSMFVPLLQLVYSSAQQVPPFKVIANAEDYKKIYIFLGSMLLAGLLILGTLISKININQALKLGED